MSADRPKPPFTYFGGKINMAPMIVALMPPHDVYIEPFFGSGAVLFAKEPARHEIINDVDHAVVNFFRVLRECPDDLIAACELSPYARGEFDLAVLDGVEVDDLELARRFWVRVNQSFAKTAGRRTGWSITTARTQSPAMSVAARIGRFSAAAERLAHVTIECRDAVDVLARATAGSVVYVDPPYLGSTRSTGRGQLTGKRQSVGDYRCDMLDDDSHVRLAAALHACPGTVFLSGYHSPLYDDLYGGWPSVERVVHVHTSNADLNNRRGRRVEVVWSNRPLPDDVGAAEQMGLSLDG